MARVFYICIYKVCAAGWRRLVFWWCVTRANELAECNAPHCSLDRCSRRNLKASIMYAECLIVRSLTCFHRCGAIRDFNAALSQKSRAASELFLWFALLALCFARRRRRTETCDSDFSKNCTQLRRKHRKQSFDTHICLPNRFSKLH